MNNIHTPFAPCLLSLTLSFSTILSFILLQQWSLNPSVWAIVFYPFSLFAPSLQFHPTLMSLNFNCSFVMGS
ncbi:MAG: hypothetical protein J3R72DRAFT_439458 [Linnemannia gamsii]|nr:MAG: hypothetical protein J3R72DRAFT_439458 [Linnemannia gamsii]